MCNAPPLPCQTAHGGPCWVELTSPCGRGPAQGGPTWPARPRGPRSALLARGGAGRGGQAFRCRRAGLQCRLSLREGRHCTFPATLLEFLFAPRHMYPALTSHPLTRRFMRTLSLWGGWGGSSCWRMSTESFFDERLDVEPLPLSERLRFELMSAPLPLNDRLLLVAATVPGAPRGGMLLNTSWRPAPEVPAPKQTPLVPTQTPPFPTLSFIQHSIC